MQTKDLVEAGLLEAIHQGRFPAGREPTPMTQGDVEYAERIAASIAAWNTRPTSSVGRGEAPQEPIGCPCPGACSSMGPLTPNARASIICDFMGWSEDGAAWTDAHRLAAKLAFPLPSSPSQGGGEDIGFTSQSLRSAPSFAVPDPDNQASEAFAGFMCKTDFDYDMRGAHDGARIYPSEEGLRDERKCVEECGIVAVRVTLERLVQAEAFSSVMAAPPTLNSAEKGGTEGCKPDSPRKDS